MKSLVSDPSVYSFLNPFPVPSHYSSQVLQPSHLKFSNQAISITCPSLHHVFRTICRLSSALFLFFTIILYLSIYIVTYIAPLQGNYSEALPAQARPKRRVLRSL